MARRVTDNIISIIKQLNKEVINTKSCVKYLFQGDLEISKEELENLLRELGYISVADDYMIRKSDFIDYCRSNGLDTVSKIKKGIFMDKGIPYITISEAKLQDILNNHCEEAQPKVIDGNSNLYTIKKEQRYIVAESPDGVFKIQNIDDLIRYGLENTYISYDLLQDFCSINPDINPNKVTYLCNYRNIKLTSDDIKYTIEKIKQYKNQETKQLSIIEDINVDSFGIGTRIDYLDILKPAEMFLFLVNIEKLNAVIFTRQELYQYWSELYIKKLINTGMLIEEKSFYKINEKVFIIANEIKRNRFDKQLMDAAQIMRRYVIDELIMNHRETIVSMLLQNADIYRLVNVINRANQSGLNTMAGLAFYCRKNKLDKIFCQLFLGQRASNGIKPIKEYQDVCFSCTNIDKCIKKTTKNQNNKYKMDILLRYRNDYAEKCLDLINAEQEISILLNRPIYLKFLASYKLVVEIKPLLMAYGILKNDRILYKNSGIYCPFNDVWRVSNDLLV